MANDNNPQGLVPYGKVLHKTYYRVSTAADIYLGQPVSQTATGYVIGTSGQDTTTLLGVALGFAGPNKAGLSHTGDPFLDVSDVTPPTNGDPSGDRYVLVADDPQQEYIIQEDSGGTALTVAAIGAAINDLYRGAAGATVTGDANTGWATLEIDASSVVATLSGAYQILRLHDYVNSDGSENGSGDYAKWVVKILHHQRGNVNIGGTDPIV